LFPSPQRGNKDIHTKTFRESLKLTRTHAKLPHIAFHDLRHQFISYCVMAGVDFMTIASWVGHQDGGVLIGKVYGHLANEHKKAMASKLSFETSAAESSQPATKQKKRKEARASMRICRRDYVKRRPTAI
jgi:integrase